MKMQRIFLIGPRGSGKSTVGRRLAGMLACPVLDTDDLIRAEAGASVTDIVQREGWPGFRERESRALRRAAEEENGPLIVCTGGGIVLAPGNVDYMRATGMVLYLAAPADILYKRLSKGNAMADRPTLTGKAPLQEMAAVLEERDPLYRKAAHHVLDAAQKAAAVAEQAALLNAHFLHHP